MSDLERIPEKKDKLARFEEGYNTTTKTVAHLLGTNLALFICCLLPAFLIGFIWTDLKLIAFGWKYISDGIVTVMLFVIGEMLMMKVGADGGRLDPTYIAARKEFDTLLAKAHEVGTMFMSIFCEWQIDLELEQAILTRLRPLRFTREDWNKIKHMSYEDLEKTYGKKKAKRLIALNQLEPIDLHECILLYDDANNIKRGGVPLSGEAYMKKKTHSVEMVLSCIFTGLLTVSVVMTFSNDTSFARVMYTIFKLIALLYRMATGYSVGAKAYNTVEARQLEVKSNYLRNYIRFVEEKTYLKIGDKYGDISCYVKEDDVLPIS